MALKVFVRDTVTGACDLRELVPYTSVTSADGSVVITSSVGTNGQPIYDLAASVDVNVNNFSYNSTTKEITLTETDGDSYTIDISDLVDTETVTTLVANVDGSYAYTSEDGTITNIAATSPSVVTNTIAGNRIATHDDGNGAVVEIDETITSLADNGDSSFSYTAEDGNTTTISVCDLFAGASDTGQFIGG